MYVPQNSAKKQVQSPTPGLMSVNNLQQKTVIQYLASPSHRSGTRHDLLETVWPLCFSLEIKSLLEHLRFWQFPTVTIRRS